MERILASMARLEPEVAPLDGVFRTAVNHHTAVRTSNIVRALKFYSLLGMKEVRSTPFLYFFARSVRCADSVAFVNASKFSARYHYHFVSHHPVGSLGRIIWKLLFRQSRIREHPLACTLRYRTS